MLLEPRSSVRVTKVPSRKPSRLNPAFCAFRLSCRRTSREVMAAKNTYYAQPTSFHSISSVNPRPLLPFFAPPGYLTLYPPFPPSGAGGTPRKIGFEGAAQWAVTTHVVPG